ncbi:unnamed protein product [Orchesella dallaii]|uniref:Uncharacterized protein n=1 Tax=Orchesella dallaii TaxID=48710 RepID=A0ABP1RNW4_9HEXA
MMLILVLHFLILFNNLDPRYSYVKAIPQLQFPPKLDLNPLLNSFSNCLLHLTAYEFQLPTNLSTSEMQKLFPQDMKSFNEPAILSRYLVKLLNIEELYKRTNDDSTSHRTGNQTAFLFPPRVHNFLCVVQIYIIPQASILTSDVEDTMYFFRDGHGTIISPKVVNFTSKWAFEYKNAPTILKPEVYQVLVVDEPDRVLRSWSIYVDQDNAGVRRNTVANHFTKLVIKLSPETNDLHNAHLVYNDVLDYISVPIRTIFTSHASSMRASTELMLRKIYRRIKCNWFGGSKHMGYFKFQELAGSMSYATDDYTKYIGLRHFKSWMLSDLLVFQIVFPNCTLIQDMSNQEKVPRRGGTITFGDMATPYMAFEEGGFKFITCGGGERGMMSLIGYVSAFDTYIWGWFAFFVFGVAISVFLLHNRHDLERNESDRVSTLNCIFMPIDTILEHGSPISDLGNVSQGICCISGVWILVGVVLSNAYKGQNITDLSSPIPPIKPTKFTELLDKNFTIYTYSDDEQLNEIDKWTEPFLNFFFTINRTNITDDYDQKPNILSKLVEEADPKTNIVQKYIRIHEKIHNFTSIELYNMSQNISYVGYLEKIKNCDNTAFMGWHDEIESSRLHLDDILFNAGRHYDKEFISISEEMLFQLRIGWTLKDVTIVTPDLPQRMSILVESGIGQEWKTIETFVRNLQLAIKTNSRPIPLPTLKLNDNIGAVFYVHCVLLLFTCVVFIIEQCCEGGVFALNLLMKLFLRYYVTMKF